MWNHIIIEMINLGSTLFAAIIFRWLLNLSTPEQDIKWIKATWFWKMCARLKFYRGFEYVHQVRARRVYTSSSG